jgi:hypothetical protein
MTHKTIILKTKETITFFVEVKLIFISLKYFMNVKNILIIKKKYFKFIKFRKKQILILFIK